MKPVLAWLNENHAAIVHSLAELVAVPSISTDGEHQKEVEKSCQVTCELMRQSGLNNVDVLRTTNSNPYAYGEWLGAPGAATAEALAQDLREDVLHRESLGRAAAARRGRPVLGLARATRSHILFAPLSTEVVMMKMKKTAKKAAKKAARGLTARGTGAAAALRFGTSILAIVERALDSVNARVRGGVRAASVANGARVARRASRRAPGRSRGVGTGSRVLRRASFETGYGAERIRDPRGVPRKSTR